jgi:hypothetical protein
MSDLYDTDIVAWSEHQSVLLRRHAAGELGNEVDIDWPHVAEEIEAAGQSQTDRVESLPDRALVHRLKAQAWPLSRDVPHWLGEERGFRAQARRRFRESMRQKLDSPGLYADALEALPGTMDGVAPQPLGVVCPVTLDDLLRHGTA